MYQLKESIRTVHVALVGNPNVGKSVIFGHMTGEYVTVSNYPGTTVEISEGASQWGGTQFKFADTPGVFSIFPRSEDERACRDHLLDHRPDVLLQVADAKNLRRALMLTLELAELGLPMVLALNMADESRARGILIDTESLSKTLGIPVVLTAAPRGEGIQDLKEALSSARVPIVRTDLEKETAKAIETISALIPEAAGNLSSAPAAFIAETLLHGDESIWNSFRSGRADLQKNAIEAASQISRSFARPPSLSALDSRLQLSGEITADVMETAENHSSGFLRAFGRAAMRPWPGYLIAGLALALLYAVVGYFAAQILVDFLKGFVFDAWIIPAAIRLADAAIPSAFLREMLVGPYGIITMAVPYAFALILPIVTFFFLMFGFLEDSGYLPRLAVMLDRVFRLAGLNGKAIIPVILGLGCNTMAVLTTRILETKRERLIATLILSLSIPCSAQLGTILGMMASLSWKAFVLWFLTVAGSSMLVGWGASKFLPGSRSPFLMEIPPLRVPLWGNTFKKLRSRIAWYLREAAPLFLAGTLLLFFADKTGLLAKAREFASPLVVGFLGLPAMATDSMILGFLRRDYGAAGFFDMSRNGTLSASQAVVALIVITLFMPCIAQFLVTIKERGVKVAVAIAFFILAFSVGLGGFINWVLKTGVIRL